MVLRAVIKEFFGSSFFSLRKCSRIRKTARISAQIRNVYLRSEEHTSELQSHHELVCRLLLEKKKQHLQQLPSPASLQGKGSEEICYREPPAGLLGVVLAVELSRHLRHVTVRARQLHGSVLRN